jgi:hypothetical protein
MKQNSIRAAAGVLLLVGAATLHTQAAVAGNSSWNAPRADPERYDFCENPQRWYVGFRFGGYSVNGTAGGWTINYIRDDPHQTAFDATFTDQNSGVRSFVSFYCV